MVQRAEERAETAWLIAALRAGSEPAGTLLVRRYQRRLLAHAARVLGDSERAKDAVQAAWLEIFAALPRLRDDYAFSAFAYRIVTRACARQTGQQIRDRRLGAALQVEAATGEATAEPEPAAPEGGLMPALATLPAGQRAAIALFYLEDMSIAEVAVALDVPAGTVKTRLMHARRKLREALEGGSHD